MDGSFAALWVGLVGHPQGLTHRTEPGDLGDDLRIGLGTRPLLGGDLSVEVGVGEQALVVVHGVGGAGGGACGV